MKQTDVNCICLPPVYKDGISGNFKPEGVKVFKMENDILALAQKALQDRSKVRLSLKSGEMKNVWILNILNNKFIIIKEKRFLLFARFTLLDLQEIKTMELH